MARRDAVAAGRAALTSHIRDELRSGRLAPGSALPALRDLADRFGISRATVQSELWQLIDEGLLRAESRAGIFVAEGSSTSGHCFVMTAPVGPDRRMSWKHGEAIRRGFERRVSELGGHAIFVAEDALADTAFRSRLPRLSGIFGVLVDEARPSWHSFDDVPLVMYDYSVVGPDSSAQFDRVHFDDYDGGRMATEHLIDAGHSRIAFLAVHTEPPQAREEWSARREAGWRATVQNRLPEIDPVSFHPTPRDASDEADAPLIRLRVAHRMLKHRTEFDAVVGSDDRCISDFLRAWRELDLPMSELPALVGFEGTPEVSNYVLTSIIPPWEQLGMSTAEILWQRSVGQIDGPAIERLIPLHMASRLSSHRAWNESGILDAVAL